MSKPAFTPGPWEAVPRGDGNVKGWAVYGETGAITGWGCVTQTEANARLIAAAPALYAACQAARRELMYLIEQVDARPNGSVDRAYKQCIAALALANKESK